MKLFWAEAKEGCGYMFSDNSSLKSMYSRLEILAHSLSGSSGKDRSDWVAAVPSRGAET